MEFQSLQAHISYIAAQMPHKTALEWGRQCVSYQELDQRTNQIANMLSPKIVDHQNIPILLENSIELIEAILGVIKAGGVFAPVDPGFPENRIKLMIQTIDAEWVITHSTWLKKLDQMLEGEERRINVLVVDVSSAESLCLYKWNNLAVHPLDSNVSKQPQYSTDSLNKLCYLYFTSGSTGQPKAVLGRHRSLKHFIDWEIKEFGLDTSIRVSQLISPSFDPFLRDVFVPLCAGGTLVIPENRDIVLNPISLREWIRQKQICLIHMVPTLFKALMAEVNDDTDFTELKYILLAGEMLHGNDLKTFFQLFGQRIQLVNLYGPTETTLAKLFYRIREKDTRSASVPVGKPIDGAQVMILDSNLQNCAVGSIGEIYIRTPFISAGYYNDRERTKAVFLQNPFSKNPQDIIYKTGDVGTMLPSGDVEVIGRVDHQVKLRGIRIELGEIENQLLQLESVREAVVIAREDENGNKYLCSYVTEVGGQKTEVSRLRKHLQDVLPDYMVPSFFIHLDQMPLTPNGKIDRRALPAPETALASGVDYVVPQTVMEEKLVKIWSQMFQVENLGIHHNFFDLGGHSLRAVQLVTQLQKECQVEVPLKEIFANPTIKQLSAYIERKAESRFSSIQPVEDREYYPVSSAQKRLYILSQMEGLNTSYNIPRVMILEGRLDVHKLEERIKLLINRHETLRTSFESIQGNIVQRVHQEVDFVIPCFEALESELPGIVREFVQLFDLKKAPLLRILLVRLSEEKHALLFDMHHTISDGASMAILIREMIQLYNGQELVPLPIQYRDFAIWQNDLFESDVIRQHECFWRETFAGCIPVLHLPTDYPYPPIRTYAGEGIHFELDEGITKELKALSQETGATLYMILLAGYNILLSKYSGQEDIVVGSPIAGRHYAGLEGLIGMFINTLALRNEPAGMKTFKQFLGEVRENALQAYSHQDYQFEQLVEVLNIQRDLGRSPLFDVMFVMQDPDQPEVVAGDLKILPYRFENRSAKYDLTLYAIEDQNTIRCLFTFRTDIFRQETVRAFIASFQEILTIIVTEPEKPIYQIGKVSAKEQKPTQFTQDLRIANLQKYSLESIFYVHVDQAPENIAIEVGKRTVTYAELDWRSNALANSILQMNFEKGSPIVIMTLDRIEIITAILGIMKAGCVFVPFDLAYPQKRLETLLQITNPGLIITDQNHLDFVTSLATDMVSANPGVSIRLMEDLVESGEIHRPEITHHPDDDLYLYFTSGSTGEPKGIVGRYQGLLHFCLWEKTKLNLTRLSKVSQLSSPAFDPFLRDVFVPLLAGGTICIPETREIGMSGERLAHWIDRSGVNLIHCVPSVFKLILQTSLQREMFANLQYILLAGERVTPQMLTRWYGIFGERIQLVNVYGPTEVTLFKACYFIGEADCKKRTIPVGQAIEGSQIMILDEERNLCCPGVSGEIHFRTPYRSKGYFQNPELTAAVFVPNPFANDEEDLLYKTGDLGRMLPDGNLEFIGRVDNQVKIRGVRIERGEIENTLLKHPAVLEAAVNVQSDRHGENELAAYLVLQEQVTALEVREFLARSLPEYMIPAYFVILDHLPLSPNGKVDYKSLPEVADKLETGVPYVAPQTGLECALGKIWSEILGREKIGIHDNFFILGGHSLKATALVSRIFKELNVELPLRTVFTHQTIHQLARVIEESAKSTYLRIEPVEEQDDYPVSSVQKRLFLLQQMDSRSTSYNIPKVFLITGELNVERLTQTFRQLIQRHETLRTSFATIDGKIIQRVHPEVDFAVMDQEAAESELPGIVQQFVQPFDLQRAPLLRVGLVKLAENRSVLLVDLHHIIADGTSIGLLVKEFASLYEGKELVPLRLQYKDYAAWQNELFAGGVMGDQERYWLEMLSGEIPVLNLPTDYPRPRVHTFEGGNLFFELSAELTQKLKSLTRVTGTTLYMVLLASYNILLAKYSGIDDILVGSPIAGRHHADLEGLIGMFVNTLVLRNRPQAEKRFIAFLREVSENALRAFENQDYQFEQLVEMLNLPRDLSRSPLFDVTFVMQAPDHAGVTAGDLRVAPYQLENRAAKYDLTLYAVEGETIRCTLNYRTALFTRETIQAFVSSFLAILTKVVDEPEIQIGAIGKVAPRKEHPFAAEFARDITVAEWEGETLEEYFYRNVDQNPEKIAISYGQKSLTYAGLDQKSNAIANSLHTSGLKPGSRVGIMSQDRLSVVTAVLGILKAGYIFVPFDLAMPEKRLETLMHIADLQLILTDETSWAQVKNVSAGLPEGGNPVKIHLLTEFCQKTTVGRLVLRKRPDEEIYLYFTSGSTGQPKGIVGRYQSLLHFVFWEIETLQLTHECKVSQLSSPAFDAFLRDLFVPLVAGGTICIPESRENMLNGAQLAHWIEHSGVTVIHCVPSVFKLLNQAGLRKDQFPNLTYILLSGERITPQMLDHWYAIFADRIQLVNLYGPTETTMVKTYYFIQDADKKRRVIPVGKAMKGSQILILDEEKHLCLPGIPGEIYIRTPYRTKGYFANPELFAETFIPNPFSRNVDDLLYKTGDFGRILPDGNIEFIGRVDHQVKVRGVRIEPGEIENTLLKHPAVREAAVIDRNDRNGELQLISYLVLQEPIPSLELREFLRGYFPEYMLPGYFITLERFPLTSTGKIDRQALPEPEGEEITGIEYEPPITALEVKLVKIWSEILGRERIGVNDNFFLLGGHSLKAMILGNKIYQEFAVELSLKTIFLHPTIRSLAQVIETSSKSVFLRIEPVEVRENYPTSPAQKRIYLLQQLEENATSYNMPKALEVFGQLEVERLTQIFQTLIRRHESLRTSFEMVDGTIVQKVQTDVDWTICDREAGEEQLAELCKRFVKPFDLSQSPLFRVELIRLTETRHLLLVDMHHIISDGISVGILMKEFVSLYGGQVLPDLPVQYKDFAVWQNTLIENRIIKAQEAYWLETFNGEIPVLNLPTDYPRPSVQSFRGGQIGTQLDGAMVRQLKELASQTGSTMYMVLLAVLNVLLAKYTGQEEIVVGSPTAGRRHADLHNVIGMFVNTLAMKNAPYSGKKFLDFLTEVRENTLKAYDHEDYQFEELVEKLNLHRDLSRNPLFDVMFSVKNFDREVLLTDGLEFVPYQSPQHISKFDLTIDAVEGKDSLSLSMEYCIDLFSQETMERFLTHYVNIVRQIIRNPQVKLAGIDLLTAAERQQIVVEFNATQMEYAEDKTLHELFMIQADQSPERIAFVFDDEQLTYRELNTKTNQLAHLLRENGVKQDEIVGIMAERSIDQVIGILAVLKAGGAYMPVDPDYPEERVKYMLIDSNTRLLLTHHDFARRIGFTGQVIDLNAPECYITSGHNVENINRPSDLAYIMYTSGSTGKPKGVMLEHKGVVSLAKFYDTLFCFAKHTRMVHMSNVSFDGSIVEIFPPLLYGATVYILRKEIALDRKEFIKFLQDHRINIAQFVPVTLKELLTRDGKVESLHAVLVAGDRLEDSLREKVLALGYQLTNHYGPTEGTVDSIVALCEQGKTTIGKPIANNRAYILDKDNNPTPIGVPGELCIAGVGLARGYLNQPELTAEKFVQHPFLPGERIYRTGDLASWQRDGNITFIGRKDQQVKIRGYRIEPEEIVAQLLKLAKIKDAIVIDQVDPEGVKYLCAYIVANGELTTAEIRVHLLQELPDYMIPSYFVQMDRFPVTSSGKVDRKALPEPEGGMATGVEYVAPTNELEEQLITIWQEILGQNGLGTRHNFFEIGGHSLKAMVLVSRIHKELHVEVPLAQVFKTPTIMELAKYMAGTEKNLYTAIQPVEERAYYPASSAQKRLFIPCQFKETGTSYNMPGVLRIEGLLDRERLEDAFCALVQRHETLRTSFELIDEEIVQRIHSDVGFSVAYEEAEEERIEEIVDMFVQPFDLGIAPLIRVKLVKLQDHLHILLFDLHHIIADGASISILVNEFVSLYEGQILPALSVQYKDFSVWQNELFKTAAIEKQKQYWLETLRGPVPQLTLPTDYPRPAVQSYRGSKVHFELDETLTGNLKALCRQQGVTLYMLLLAGFNVLLSKYTGLNDIVVGSPIAGRPHADLQGIIGMFVNTLAMRNDSGAKQTFTVFLKRVKATALKAYENQDYPFEQLIEQLGYSRDISRNPMFDVVFVMQNTDQVDREIAGLMVRPYHFEHTIAKFDLYVTAQEVSDRICFNIIYCTDLFKPETMERLARHLKYILSQVVENPEIPLAEIGLFSPEEKEQLLESLKQSQAVSEISTEVAVMQEKDRKIEAEFEF